MGSVRLKRLAYFEQCLQARKDARPSIGAKSVGRIIFGSIILRDNDLGGSGLRHQLDGRSRQLGILSDCKRVLTKSRRFDLQNLTVDVGHRFTIGTRPNPCDGTSGFSPSFQFRTREDDTVENRRDEPLPSSFWFHSKVKDEL
jgi:hypothetical protein